MSASVDRDRLIVDETVLRNGVALVHGQAEPAVRILVQERLALAGIGEGRLPVNGEPAWRGRPKFDEERGSRPERADGGNEVGGQCRQLGVAERVAVDERGPEAAVA